MTERQSTFGDLFAEEMLDYKRTGSLPVRYQQQESTSKESESGELQGGVMGNALDSFIPEGDQTDLADFLGSSTTTDQLSSLTEELEEEVESREQGERNNKEEDRSEISNNEVEGGRESGKWVENVLQCVSGTDRNKQTTNHNSLFRSRDWLSANQGPVFADSVGSWCVNLILSDPDLPGPDLPEPRFTGRIKFPRYTKFTLFDPDIPGTPIYRAKPFPPESNLSQIPSEHWHDHILISREHRSEHQPDRSNTAVFYPKYLPYNLTFLDLNAKLPLYYYTAWAYLEEITGLVL
eukprot:sb/3467542/